MGQRGFSVIEMMIIFAIMSILVVTAYPLLGSASARDVDNAARELAADLQLLQQLSINSVSTGLPTIKFTKKAPFGYDIKSASNVAIKPTVSLPSTVIIKNSPDIFNFDIEGRCDSSKSIILQSDNIRRYIIIDKNGRIHISKTVL